VTASHPPHTHPPPAYCTKRLPGPGSGFGRTDTTPADEDSEGPATAWWTRRFALAVVLTGLAAGLGAVALTLLLHAVQHLAFGYTEDTFLTGVHRASALRRVGAVTLGGVVVGTGWWLHRRLVPDGVSVTHALSTRAVRLPVLATATDSALQILAVGAGASLGREGAPRQLGAALGSAVAARLGLSLEQRRVLLAAGAGAGLAAVYNVPLGGAAFTLEVLLASMRLRAVVPAVVTAGLATAAAWPVLGTRATYQTPTVPTTVPVLVAALVLGPLLGLVGLLFRTVMTAARTHAPSGWRAAAAVPVVFAAVGATAIAYPQLLGNGKGLAQLALTGSLSIPLAVALAIAKPAVTAACLRDGAIGGLLTPSFATGAVLGLIGGVAWSQLWTGGSPTAYALLGAAAMLAVTQRAAATAVILALEFTHAGLGILPGLVIAVSAARATEHTAVLVWQAGRRRATGPDRSSSSSDESGDN
jgi:H+/Cl- antiporter ClcA